MRKRPKYRIKGTKRNAIIKDSRKGLSNEELSSKYNLPLYDIVRITKIVSREY